MASSSSSSRQTKHQVFLSFRGEDTRLNFTSHLLKALKDTGLNVFFDEETLERGEQISPALSNAIMASNLSIIILSKDYASSKSCLAEISCIMYCKLTRRQIVLPIFYHVDPSDVRNLGGSFKTSFNDHESKSLDQVQRWKEAFADVGKLKGWHIEGGKFDRPETKYIKDIVEYVAKKLMNNKSSTAFEELVGIDYQKKTILKLINQNDCRVIGLWGMAGIGKTTLANVVYHEICSKFKSCWFLQNVGEKIRKQGMESLRNNFLSKILDQEIDVLTPSIGSAFIRERLNNKKVIVVVDDVDDPDLIDYLGVKHFGDGSKIILISRDRQVLKNGGAEKIHKVNELNEKSSLQLFSTFAFKQLNPTANFRDLSNQFVRYAQGNPLALKVLGSKLYTKSRKEWESEVDRLKEYGQPKISQILKSSFDELDELEKNLFLDIACFFKGKYKKEVEDILCSLYNGAVCGISNLVDKCLLDTIHFQDMLEEDLRLQDLRRSRSASTCQSAFAGRPLIISMHDILEEMGKDIIRQEATGIGNCSRLWSPNNVHQMLRYNKGNEAIKGIKLDMSQIDNLKLSPTVFENMLNLRFIHFYLPRKFGECWNKKLLADQVDIVSLPDELRYLCWEYYPFKSLSSSFNPKNLVVLKLPHGDMEQLWNGDNHQDLVSLKEIDLFDCKNLRKIPSLLGAINLKSLCCMGCESLVELPCLTHLASLESFDLDGCHNLKKIPEIPSHFHYLDLEGTRIEEVPDSIEHLIWLRRLRLRNSRLTMNHCKSLKLLLDLPPHLWRLDARDCPSLEKVSFIQQHGFLGDPYKLCMMFFNCINLNQDSIDSIEANAMFKIGSIAETWAGQNIFLPSLVCCFPGTEISANKFESQNVYSSLTLKIAPNVCGKRRFLAFAICLVADLTHCSGFGKLELTCEYQLTVSSCSDGVGGYEKFKSVLYDRGSLESEWNCMGDHVLILFQEDMVKEDKNYEEATFEFYIRSYSYNEEGEKICLHDFKVKKCGVHVFYVGAKSCANGNVESSENSNLNEMSNDESDDSFYSAEEAFFEEANSDTQKRLYLLCFVILNFMTVICRFHKTCKKVKRDTDSILYWN
ncbi:disease resistance protein RPV1 [Gossypium raimondii]|nr:disease resistance protein RPV1 [Gossypium raimondii]